MWRELPRLRKPDRLQAWARQIAVNECRQELRRRRSVGFVAQLPMHSGTDLAALVADRDEMGSAFGRLRPEHREVLVLRYYVGLEPWQIAEATGERPGTIRSRLHHALRSLRAELESERRTVDSSAT